MPFWVYMLHCRDRTFYVGHTDDLDVCLAQHEQGTLGGYTIRKRPVKLVWSQEFPTRYEALEAERRIKGWRREKKLALIREDWDLISELSRRRKERPSTGSGRTGGGGSASPKAVRPRLVEGRSCYLFRHPGCESPSVTAIQVQLVRRSGRFRLRYSVLGDIEALALPDERPPARLDELWRHTCFEAFIRSGEAGYCEFNFSPSGEWAAYRFDSYRAGMRPLEMAAPAIRTRTARRELCLDVQLSEPVGASHLNLTAVIEEKSGTKSFWALAHPPEGPPDFHHPACFVLELPPPGTP
jgi:predicted GIY-YIG superfamily endonuclease